ncbi:MAG: zinc-binding alcohol dehydrogenase family protein [Candidatus Sumerlaeia bacterium]|nr:zinc-binding alcohol dehydrogenase family protein [Candidatus Sumerlaeia bacterium]
MKAWLLDDFRGLEALRFADEVATPNPKGGEVLVRIAVAGLNPADRYLSEKLYPARPPFPHVLGRDGSGIVEATGEGVKNFKPGDKVALLRGDAGVERWGSLAEFVSVPAEVVVPVPEGWTMEEAAAAPLVYLTAWQALTQWEPLEAGAPVVISGISGGVGLASLHLCKAMGLSVAGLTRSEKKGAELVDNHGLDVAFNPGSATLKKQIRDFAGRRGVALYIDNVAGPLFNVVIETLGKDGRVSCVGRLAGEVPDFNTARLFFKRIRIGGVSAGDYSSSAAHAAWDHIVEYMTAFGKRPVIDSVHPFTELLAAFEQLREGPLGKVLVRVGDV